MPHILHVVMDFLFLVSSPYMLPYLFRKFLNAEKKVWSVLYLFGLLVAMINFVVLLDAVARYVSR